MKGKRFTETQIAFAVGQAESGTPVEEICRKVGAREATFYRWKKKFGGLGVAEVRRLKQWEEENRKLEAIGGRSELGSQDVAGCPCKKGVRPARRRERVEYLRTVDRISELKSLWGSIVCALHPPVPIRGRPAGRTENPIKGAHSPSGALRLPAVAPPVAAGGLASEP